MGKASFSTSHAGKVKIWQRVNIRFDNFPDNEFGMVQSVVRNISIVPSKINNKSNYIVEIELPSGLETTYHKTLQFLPEKVAQADIVTEDISF